MRPISATTIRPILESLTDRLNEARPLSDWVRDVLRRRVEAVRDSGQIGIPRAFYYYSHPRLWETFFGELGIEPIVSPKSSRKTLELASLVSEAEHCLPNKLFDAHLVTLKDRVEVIFVPRILSTIRRHIACPKLGALPDAAGAQLARSMTIVTIDVDENRRPLRKTLISLARDLGFSKRKRRSAARLATLAMDDGLAHPEQFFNVRRSPRTSPSILIIGHPYILHDPLMSEPILRTLERLDVRAELVSFADEHFPTSFIKWGTCNKTYHRLTKLSRHECAGVIQISSFNCGCDSMTTEVYQRVLKKKKIPYMVLILDEHSTFVGVDTRLEAFTESLRW